MFWFVFYVHLVHQLVWLSITVWPSATVFYVGFLLFTLIRFFVKSYKSDARCWLCLLNGQFLITFRHEFKGLESNGGVSHLLRQSASINELFLLRFVILSLELTCFYRDVPFFLLLEFLVSRVYKCTFNYLGWPLTHFYLPDLHVVKGPEISDHKFSHWNYVIFGAYHGWCTHEAWIFQNCLLSFDTCDWSYQLGFWSLDHSFCGSLPFASWVEKFIDQTLGPVNRFCVSVKHFVVELGSKSLVDYQSIDVE